jgi:hypothetical protein
MDDEGPIFVKGDNSVYVEGANHGTLDGWIRAGCGCSCCRSAATKANLISPAQRPHNPTLPTQRSK